MAPLLLALASLGAIAPVHAVEVRNGAHIMAEAFRRQEQYPYVYEEQTMVLTDDAGNRDVRRARRFSRLESDGTGKYLLVFDDPPEIRGVALLAVHHPDGRTESKIYLPAIGRLLDSGVANDRSSHFLGTDFTVSDLTPEILSDFDYRRAADEKIDGVPCYVIDATPRDAAVARATGYSRRRLFVRQDNYVTMRVDYFDRRGRLFKRLSRYDLKRVSGDMWRANMILVHDYHERHSTLLKINRRVFSRDYVPAEIFTPQWLLSNRQMLDDEQMLRSARGREPGPPPATEKRP